MTQPHPDASGWNGPPPQYGPGPQYGPQPYGAPQYGPQPYGAPQYGPQPYGAPQYGPQPYGAPQYGPPQYGQPSYGAPQYGGQYGGPEYGGPQYGVYGGSPYRPPAPEPGSIPLRPLGVSDILDGSFRLIRRNPRVMLGLSAAVAVVRALFVSVATAFSFSALHRISVTSANDSSGTTNLGPLFGSEGVQVLTTLIGVLLAAVLTGMLTVAITQDIIGVRMTVAEVWARARRRIWAIIGISVLATLVETIGLVFCIAPGIWLWGIWSVSVPALMVEDLGVRKALGRSRQLVSGTFWRVWGIRALGYLMVSFAVGLLSAPFTVGAIIVGGGFGGSGTSSGGALVGVVLLTAVGQIIAGTIATPVQSGIDALLYVDLRMRKEGLDIQLQLAAQQVQQRAAATSGVGVAAPDDRPGGIAGSAF